MDTLNEELLKVLNGIQRNIKELTNKVDAISDTVITIKNQLENKSTSSENMM
jgi:archaellum component FlaC